MNKHIEEITTFHEQLINQCLPGNSIDCVIFGFDNHQLKVLLLQWKHEKVWSLPGGFIDKNDDMDEAAYRVLQERTGLKSIFLNQFYTFGGKERSQVNGVTQAKRFEKLLKGFKNVNQDITNWLKQRFITTGYFALIDINKTKPRTDFLSEKCEWKSIKDLPELMMDHRKIVKKALDHLHIQLNYLPIGINLLPQKFTMQDLQKLYEAILRTPLERSNFQRKILKLGILVRLEKQMSGAANKAPYLYKFDKVNYQQLIEKGIGFVS